MIKLIQLNVEMNNHYERIFPFLKKQKADVICLQEVKLHDIPLFEKKLGMKAYHVPRKFIEKYDDFEAAVILSKHKFVQVLPFTYLNGKLGTYSLIKAVIKTPEKEYTIMTTHYMVSKLGKLDKAQKAGWKNLKPYLKKQKKFVFTGDFNAPRGRGMFALLNSVMKENLPKEIKTTLDQKLHRVKGLMYAVDNIFTKGYKVKDVQVHDGVSDHMALTCYVE